MTKFCQSFHFHDFVIFFFLKNFSVFFVFFYKPHGTYRTTYRQGLEYNPAAAVTSLPHTLLAGVALYYLLWENGIRWPRLLYYVTGLGLCDDVPTASPQSGADGDVSIATNRRGGVVRNG